MCTPGDSHSPSSTGVCEVVAVTNTSAPRTASSAEAAARMPCSSANARARRGLHTLTSRNSRTSRSASRWLRACTPEPMIASTEALDLARRSVATAETAAVRTSVMSRPSMVTRGSPVSGLKSSMVAWWVGTSVLRG
jgi:hypothetical protein